MFKIILAIILGLYPIIHQLWTRFETKNKKSFNSYKNNPACFYLDWLFIPINVLIIFAVSWNYLWFCLILLASIAFNAGTHYFWSGFSNGFMFNKKGLSFAGKLHFIFSSIETLMIMYFLVFMLHNIYAHIILGTLVLFNIFLPYSSYKIFNGKPLKSDLIFSIVLFLVLVIRIII